MMQIILLNILIIISLLFARTIVSHQLINGLFEFNLTILNNN